MIESAAFLFLDAKNETDHRSGRKNQDKSKIHEGKCGTDVGMSKINPAIPQGQHMILPGSPFRQLEMSVFHSRRLVRNQDSDMCVGNESSAGLRLAKRVDSFRGFLIFDYRHA
ncbi:hypothetical protein [Ekhidna sp.]|uniref:hypothetical protein n=1 Tax=Ekhidna sp. TaxID=2608089 RepID=UPI003B5C25CA